jgi:hypothetical protein
MVQNMPMPEASRLLGKPLQARLIRGGAVVLLAAALLWQNVRTIPRIHHHASRFLADEGLQVAVGHGDGPSVVTFEKGWPLAYQSEIVAWRHAHHTSYVTLAYVIEGRRSRHLKTTGPEDAVMWLDLGYPAWLAIAVNSTVALLLAAAPAFLAVRVARRRKPPGCVSTGLSGPSAPEPHARLGC